MKKFAILVVASSLLSAPAFACSCRANISVGDHYDAATHVFTAVIRQVQPTSDLDTLKLDDWLIPLGWQNMTSLRSASFRVTSTLKGEPETLPSVFTHPDSATCGLELSVGEELLLFADERGVVHLCGGSVPRSNPNWRSVIGDIRRHQAESLVAEPPPVLELRPDE